MAQVEAATAAAAADRLGASKEREAALARQREESARLLTSTVADHQAAMAAVAGAYEETCELVVRRQSSTKRHKPRFWPGCGGVGPQPCLWRARGGGGGGGGGG
eukprot:COSAG01_NODE_7497_length_3184_cov_1.594489_1_plen_103_part_10